MRLEFRPQAEPAVPITPLFVTPMIDCMLDIATPPFLEAMRQHVLAMERRDRGRNVSNFGGWHSSGDFFAQGVDIIRRLGAEVLKAAGHMSYEQVREAIPRCAIDVAFFGGSWANISRNGDYNKPHSHPGAVWSGVFYVDLGIRDQEPADNGWIEFIDPRGANIYGGKMRIAPKPGQLLIFPAWLQHYVNPFRGQGERVSIAFNTKAHVDPA